MSQSCPLPETKESPSKKRKSPEPDLLPEEDRKDVKKTSSTSIFGEWVNNEAGRIEELPCAMESMLLRDVTSDTIQKIFIHMAFDPIGTYLLQFESRVFTFELQLQTSNPEDKEIRGNLKWCSGDLPSCFSKKQSPMFHVFNSRTFTSSLRKDGKSDEWVAYLRFKRYKEWFPTHETCGSNGADLAECLMNLKDEVVQAAGADPVTFTCRYDAFYT